MAIDDFHGRAHLIETINAAVALGDDAAVVQALRSGLCRMMRERSVELPACVLQPVEGHYDPPGRRDPGFGDDNAAAQRCRHVPFGARNDRAGPGRRSRPPAAAAQHVGRGERDYAR